jgi:hypothetical protein
MDSNDKQNDKLLTVADLAKAKKQQGRESCATWANVASGGLTSGKK